MNEIHPHPVALNTAESLFRIFMGNSPSWYKWVAITCLILNPVLLITLGPFVTGWAILIQFIATLAGALMCNPLLPGGLLLIQSIALGLVTADKVNEEIFNNLPVMLLVLFVVTAVYFLKDFMTFIFMKVIVSIRSKYTLAFLFCLLSALLSATLDALTVVAVISAVLLGLYNVYHFVASKKHSHEVYDSSNDEQIHVHHHEDLQAFRSFLRSRTMHSGVGTMLGGIITMIGEPQNLLIAKVMGWNFVQFFHVMAPVTIPVCLAGLVMSVVVEKIGWSDYGVELPVNVLHVIERHVKKQSEDRTKNDAIKFWIQGLLGAALVVMLTMHIAEIYIIGLILLIMVTVLTGKNKEHDIGEAVKDGAPFVFILAIFFGIVGVIHTQHLFAPITEVVLSYQGNQRLVAFFVSTGLLSAISDNVFVATLYISEARELFDKGIISREEFENIAVAINAGTNIPSISTPNGQAAFLFLLMSPLAPLIKLTYTRMMLLAVPYVVVTTLVAVMFIWAL